LDENLLSTEQKIRLVTLSGECFEVEFQSTEVNPHRDGVSYLFYVTDLRSGKGRRLVSLLVPSDTPGLDKACLNAIRRAFDSGAFDFDQPYDPMVFKELPFTRADIGPQPRASDAQIRQLIRTKAYWLSWKLGNRYPIQFDSSVDLEYLGIDTLVVRQNQWFLEQKGLLEQSTVPGMGRPTGKLIEEFESQRTAPLPTESSIPSSTATLDARSAPPEVSSPPAAAAPPPPEIKTPPIVAPPKSSIVGNIRKQVQHLWDASARWDWQTLVFVFGTGGFLVVGEYALAVISFFLAGFGLTSRIVHNDSTSRWRKLLGSAFIVIIFAGAVYIVNDIRGSQPWSHLEKLIGNPNAAIQTIDVHAVLSQHLKPPEPPEFALVKTPTPKPKNPTTPASKPSEPPPTIIQTAPTYGNLKQRTIDLANEIVSDLYSNGWPLPRGVEPWPGIRPMPTDPKERNRWVHYRSGSFRWKCFKHVVAIRDEFAQLHIHDDDLDQFIEREQNYARDLGSNFPTWPDIFPMEIEEVARWLVRLANELPAS
jgi:hypothetical protein